MQLMECAEDVAELKGTKEWIVDVAGLAALGKIFEENRPRLLSMLQRRSDRALSARRDAEDILNQAYMRAQARWSDFQQSGMTAYAWLYRIVLDSLLDDHDFQMRKRRNPRAETAWPDKSSLQLVLGLVSPLTSPSDALARKESHERLCRQVGQALGLLKPDDREILCMRFYDQLSTEEMAGVLNLSEATARQRYSRARLRFRETWRKLFGDEGAHHG